LRGYFILCIFDVGNIYKGEYILDVVMVDKNLRILKIMRKKKCDWEEAEFIEKETKTITDFC